LDNPIIFFGKLFGCILLGLGIGEFANLLIFVIVRQLGKFILEFFAFEK